jgi:hypothetical protein
MNASKSHGSFWAITSFFNPTGSARRLSNYRVFRRALNIPLVAVEWSWTNGPGPQLREDDAEVLIQLSGPDLIWQKERLLNLAISALPDDCLCVAWLDCDVLFDNPSWHTLAALKLEEYPIVQLYDTLVNLGPDNQPLPVDKLGGHVIRPIASAEVRASLPQDFLCHKFSGTPVACGHAWAGRTELLRKHGLYDACVVGSGDRAIFCAEIGCSADAATFMRMNSSRTSHYLAWADPFYKDVVGRTGWIAGQARNLWHGSLLDRKYEQRHIAFEAYNFDPVKDLEIDKAGCWQWATDKQEMHAFVVEYFFGRNEDSERVSLARTSESK